ncbi:molybdopterin molybdotransferase MoeA [Pseudomonas sp.]|uniref:molybdopterin molybdotransferase MoeA n=1 Tax=Pseudomonas sp. TaxID=306 RepID=UPI00272C1493|nr:gephyrin-like molybdotransferase Glp [Pseudomonas sp.]
MKGCDCADEPLMPVEAALQQMLERLPPPLPSEAVPLDAASGRILAQTLYAPADVPAWDNSAMDGYALRFSDWRPGIGMSLGGRIAAGQVGGRLEGGQAVRIFTGAPLPEGADTVVAQEDCRLEQGQLLIDELSTGSHVRRRGEDSHAGDLLLAAGTLLRPTEIGLLASRGVGALEVFRRLRVALVSTGDELREPGEPLAPGQIHNANRPMLKALLEGWGCVVIDGGTLPDRHDVTRRELAALACEADVLITSGGVSVGEEDHIRNVVKELGGLHLWRLAIQPGKPLAFGEVRGTTWIGLPGNPVASLVTALVVARPWLWRAMGRSQRPPQPVVLPSGFGWPKPRVRAQFLRACLASGPDGSLAVLHGQQGSAQLAALSWAEGLVEIEAGRTFESGAPVRYWPLADLLS